MGALSIPSGVYDTSDITASTNVRDVSSMLDLWVHRETPFLNYVNWGPESGGLIYEWIYEHIGLGYVELSGELTEGSGAGSNVITTSGVGSVAEAVKQIQSGAMLMGWSSVQATHTIWIVTDTSASGDITLTCVITGTVDAGSKMYIIGNWVNEGSVPRADVSRARTLVSNTMAILRKDIQITGSMMATDMYAVSSEFNHQMNLRMLEMQKEREMALLFSLGTAAAAVTRTASTEPLFRGLYSFLAAESGSHIDQTTTSLTDTALNNLVRACWDNGCTPNIAVGSSTQIAKFTQWDRSRVRMTPSSKMGGLHIQQYLTDSGIVLDLVPVMQFPTHFLFVLDTEQISMIAKKGRKLLVERLGIVGDYRQWQILSEFTMCAHGYGINKLGGFFDRLT